jgi:hypothetical protein
VRRARALVWTRNASLVTAAGSAGALASPGKSISALSAAAAFAMAAAEAWPGRHLDWNYRSDLVAVGVALGPLLILGAAATVAGAVPGSVI